VIRERNPTLLSQHFHSTLFSFGSYNKAKDFYLCCCTNVTISFAAKAFKGCSISLSISGVGGVIVSSLHP
jgi:hypothetical protein